jgi:cysteine-rich repeat protein
VNPLDPAGITYTGLFPYHCHILEHEDHEMMRQYETSTVCGDGIPGLPAEECDDGNTVAGDGCSPTCTVEVCNNGVDDDGDGLVDFPNDPGCQTALSPKENPRCDDDLDNDRDGTADWDGAGLGSPDPQCASRPWRDSEQVSCGIGAELVLMLPALRLLRRRRERGQAP